MNAGDHAAAVFTDRTRDLVITDTREMTDAEIESRLFRDVGRNEPPARVPIGFWHEGELPMAITWHLDHPLPGDLFASFAAAVA